MIVIRTPGKLLEKLGLQPARVPIPAQEKMPQSVHGATRSPGTVFSDSTQHFSGTMRNGVASSGSS